MPDYNIYIHSDTTQGSNPTKPWTQSTKKATSPKDDDGGNGEGVAKMINTASNPDSLVAFGVNTALKAIPYVLVAMATISLVDKTVSTVQNFNVIRSGNNYGQVQYNNFKATFSAALRPFSTTLNFFQYQEQTKVQRERLSLSQSLLGESIINSRFGGSGV